MIPICVLLILALSVPPTLPSNQRGEKICTVCGLVIQHVSSEIRNLEVNVKTPRLSPVYSRQAILTDIVEDVCLHISQYGLATGTDGTVRFIPAFDGSGRPIEHRNFEFNGELSGLYEHYCVGVVDDNFEELIGLFMSVSFDEIVDGVERGLSNRFCTQITHSCVNK